MKNSGHITREKILRKTRIGVPQRSKDTLVCLSSERIKIKDARSGRIYQHRKRIPYARFVLQKNGIDVPKGFVVFHKDGNYENNSLTNLAVMSRAELININNRRN